MALSLLRKLIQKDHRIPKNEGLQRLYEEHKAAMADPESRDAKRCDLVLKLRGKKFMCHQFVLKMASAYFEKVLINNERQMQ